MITLACPHCRVGPFFLSHPYDLGKAGDLHDKCPECGRSNHMEPGFYYGAMYVSYGLGVGACLGLFLLLRGFFPMMPLYWVIAALAGFMVLSGPYLYALSKSIWANLFIPYSGKTR